MKSIFVASLSKYIVYGLLLTMGSSLHGMHFFTKQVQPEVPQPWYAQYVPAALLPQQASPLPHTWWEWISNKHPVQLPAVSTFTRMAQWAQENHLGTKIKYTAAAGGALYVAVYFALYYRVLLRQVEKAKNILTRTQQGDEKRSMKAWDGSPMPEGATELHQMIAQRLPLESLISKCPGDTFFRPSAQLADINAKDAAGDTPAHYLMRYETDRETQQANMRLLVRLGADITNITNNNGQSVTNNILENYASEYNTAEGVQFISELQDLLPIRFASNSAIPTGANELHAIIFNRKDIDDFVRQHCTIKQDAESRGIPQNRDNVTEQLVNQKDIDGNTPAHYAIIYELDDKIQLKVLHALRACGANFDIKNNDGKTVAQQFKADDQRFQDILLCPVLPIKAE